MADEFNPDPDVIRLHHDDSNLSREVAQRREWLQTMGLDAACRWFAMRGFNEQRTWLQVRSVFDASFGEFQKAFARAMNG